MGAAAARAGGVGTTRMGIATGAAGYGRAMSGVDPGGGG